MLVIDAWRCSSQLSPSEFVLRAPLRLISRHAASCACLQEVLVSRARWLRVLGHGPRGRGGTNANLWILRFLHGAVVHRQPAKLVGFAYRRAKSRNLRNLRNMHTVEKATAWLDRTGAALHFLSPPCDMLS
jgi:hypothetical protein